VLFYPQGTPAEDLTYKATLKLPHGWKWGTSLPVEHAGADEVQFQQASLVTLVDSPVLMGLYFRTIRLAPEIAPPHELDVAADSPEALEVDPTRIVGLNSLVREELKLFGATHYRQYRFLFALSDGMSYSGLEHHESSDDRCAERSFVDPDQLVRTAQLSPHEMTHSWNGKYRRPADIASAPFLDPMGTELVWIYEGLTDYVAWLLAARSGLLTFDQTLADMAQTAATISEEPGRSWRSLRDTGAAAPLLSRSGRQGAAWRRGFGDVYAEGQLIWLEADAIIRHQTGGAKSLDNFLREFEGGVSGGPMVKPYRMQDVVEALQKIAPYDWANFFDARVNHISKQSPLGGIEGSGWHLVYTDTLSSYIRVFERIRKWTFLNFSVGLLLGSDGTIIDAYPNLSAAKAGLVPGMKLIAVNGRKWSPDRMRGAIRAAKTSRDPIVVVSESDDYITTHQIDYHGGERYPKLVRDPTKPDYITKILSPLVVVR
jgi:predicted metalloprotease with PDZ domain